MISTPFAPNDIYSLFLVDVHIFFTIQGACKPAISNIPTEKQIVQMYFPSKNKAISNSPNNITKNTVVFLYVLFSLVSSLLFSLSIGLNVIRLTDAITVAIANFKSHCTCIDNIMHRNNRKPDSKIQVCKFFA